MKRKNKEKKEDEGKKKGLWTRIKEALQSPPGMFIAALIGTAAAGGVAYAAGRRRGRDDLHSSDYRYDGGADSGGRIAEEHLWDSLEGHLGRALEIAGKGAGREEAIRR